MNPTGWSLKPALPPTPTVTVLHRAKVVIYDIKKNIRYTLTQPWDRSVEELAVRSGFLSSLSGQSLNVSQFSQNSTVLYLTAGDHARSKLFVLPIPDTPDKSTTDPSLPPKHVTPRPLTHDGAVTSIQVLPHGRLIFSRSSLQGPNDVFIIQGLHELETDLVNTQGDFMWDVTPEQITRFAGKMLAGKSLRPPEDFYFEGAEGKQVHGFVVKPYGWKEGDKKKWPGLLLIHGGMLTLAKPMNIQYTKQLYRSSRGLGRSVVNEVEPKRICTPRVFRRSN